MKDQFGNEQNRPVGLRFWKRPLVNRRMFFRHAASAVGGYMLLPSPQAKAAIAPVGTAKNVIFVLMTGAPAHVDTFDLKVGPWTPSFMAPNTYNSMAFPQGLMPNLANTIQDIALVRSIRAHATAHSLAQTWVQIGRNPIQGLNTIAPHIGSVVSLELGDPKATMPPFISLNAANGPSNGFLPPSDAPFYVSPSGNGLANTAHPDGQAAYNRRFGLLTQLDADMITSEPLGNGPAELEVFREKANAMMYNPAIGNIFTFDQTTRNSYGNTSFGNACITARNLLRANNGARFIQISFGSWDHHGNIYTPNTNLQSMARQFDAGIAALIQDLKNDGNFGNTMIVAFGEFGRTVGPLNQNAGRDHHVQQAAMFAGAQVKGGQAIGATNAAGDDVSDPGWSQQRYIWPEDIEATIYSALGIDWTKVIHGSNLGRGFEYVPQQDAVQYYPVNELWG
jgi:Protein of unknown function (DUF1501)